MVDEKWMGGFVVDEREVDGGNPISETEPFVTGFVLCRQSLCCGSGRRGDSPWHHDRLEVG